MLLISGNVLSREKLNILVMISVWPFGLVVTPANQDDTVSTPVLCRIFYSGELLYDKYSNGYNFSEKE